ncbi:MAG: substrate-binding domain-containing protein, partial [Candidatus Latescibacteria bacterium]|nr:substrate-binding domain-containing protein [Candidatus Latescibacterota bacterium]
MVLIAQRWAEIYMKKNRGVAIQVTGGGSGTGIAALINGTTNIANSSRPIKGSEKKQALQSGVDPVEFKVALDGLSVVVNKANLVNELTLRDVMGIYIGAINNWNQVGGPDAPTIRYSRESNSGTYV